MVAMRVCKKCTNRYCTSAFVNRTGHICKWCHQSKNIPAAHRTGEERLWSVGEEQVVRLRYSTRSAAWIAEELGRTERSVKHKATRMGLRKRKSVLSRSWSVEERSFLLANYGPMTAQQVGDQINRTAGAVRNYAARIR